MKTYSVGLPIFKQGDDLYYARKQANSDAEGFRIYAEQLKCSAEIMERLAMFAADNKVKLVDAGTHLITVSVADDAVSYLDDNLVLDELDDFENEKE